MNKQITSEQHSALRHYANIIASHFKSVGPSSQFVVTPSTSTSETDAEYWRGVREMVLASFVEKTAGMVVGPPKVCPFLTCVAFEDGYS